MRAASRTVPAGLPLHPLRPIGLCNNPASYHALAWTKAWATPFTARVALRCSAFGQDGLSGPATFADAEGHPGSDCCGNGNRRDSDGRWRWAIQLDARTCQIALAGRVGLRRWHRACRRHSPPRDGEDRRRQDAQALANPFQVALLDPALFPFTNEGQYCGGTLYSRGEFSTRSQSALVPLKLLRSTGPATPWTRPVVVNCQNAQSRARYFASGFAATERSQK